ncbi:MAG TPA: hypothetical protein VJ892_00205 [Candidatus Absconditabacterales bacterium]|nr:hypothetical protein [Candidatus Absconditabacterales bacterium]
MQKIIKNRKIFFDILKLVGATLILYFGLTLNVFDTGEKTDITKDENYILQSSGLQNMDEDVLQIIEKHDASKVEFEVDGQTEDLSGERNEYKMKFQRICIANMSMCSKIKFEGDFDYKDKYMYLATSIYILNNIEKNIQFGKTLKSQLDIITINNDLGSRRGYATWDDVVINLGGVRSYTEFFELLTHELGHIVDLGMVRGFKNQKSSIYTEFGKKVFELDDPSIRYYKISWQSEKVRKSEAIREDFCSGYGMTDPFEDFAECHNWYLNHNAIFKELAKNNELLKQKYNFFANLYNGAYWFNASEDLDKIQYNDSWRPWDTTRM